MSGEKEIGVNYIIINDVEYSATSSEETWSVDYVFDFICASSTTLSELSDCQEEYCDEHKEECDGLSDEEIKIFFHEREIVLEAKDKAGNYSEQASKIFRLDNSVPQIRGILSIKSIPSADIYFYIVTNEKDFFNPLFFNSGVNRYDFEYKLIDSDEWIAGELLESEYSAVTHQSTLLGDGNFDMRVRPIDFTGNIGEWHEGLIAEIHFYPVISEIYINEINNGSEWIEIYNPSENNINISGWVIDTKSDEDADITLPDGAIIPAYGFYFVGDQTSGEWVPDNETWPAPDYTETMTLTDDNGWARLRKTSGGEIVDIVGWGDAEVSEGRAENLFGYKEGYSIERLNIVQMLSNDKDNYQDRGNNLDRNRNDDDFVVRETPNPQNSLSTVEAPEY